MSTITVDIRNPQITLPDLLSEISAGTEIVFVNGEKIVARVTSAEEEERIPGLFPNSIQMSDDFDEPLTSEFLLGEE